MNNCCTILLITLFQLVAGFGVTTLFKVGLKPGLFLPLCVVMGVAVFSAVPFAMQLLHIPLSALNILLALLMVCIALNIRYKAGLIRFTKMVQGARFRVRLYEIPFLLVITAIVLISVWRCFYLPPTPRDLTSGAEVIAEYAVKEKTMVNSVFTVNLETTNNQFKSPFIASLQIIYKLAGFPFGQVWLSALFVSLVVFLYHALSATLHRAVAGLLVVMFLAIPEMYAYTFMVLFDYSNAVVFFLAIYFLILFFKNSQSNCLAFAGLLMGVATYVRSETLVLALLAMPAFVFYAYRNNKSIASLVKYAALFLGPSFIMYVLCVTVYNNHYLPVKYNVGSLVNAHLLNLKPLFGRFWDVNRQLIFSSSGVGYYGYFIFFFCGMFIAELILMRRFSKNSRNWLFAVLVVYLGLPFLGFLLPLMDIDNSTKRGMFKIFPLMLLYMANNGLLVALSRRLAKWEGGVKAEAREDESHVQAAAS